MNRFFTLLLAASCLTAVGQSEYCLEGTVWDEALGGCVPEVIACGVISDLDGDGAVGSSDLLSLLTDYGYVFPDVDSDGVCDEIDECVGGYDECGVCNGPGAVYDCGCDECVEFFECGDPVSYQGYDYQTVQIGGQCWFAENLRAEHYNNGDSIPSGLSNEQWTFVLTNDFGGAVTVYGEGEGECSSSSPDGDACDEVWSLSEYGRLYNWYAVDDARGLCPNGWHIPSFIDCLELLDSLEGADNAGGYLSSNYGWSSNGNGSNLSGFGALPGGYRSQWGDFVGGGDFFRFWSSTTYEDFDPDISWTVSRFGGAEDANVMAVNHRQGLSVRCLKD